MMNYLCVTIKRSLIASVFLLGFTVVLDVGLNIGSHPADPSDDFSFSVKSLKPRTYQTMSEQAVAAVLGTRLDFFSKEKAPELARHLVELSHEFRFDPAFILSLIQVESGFRSQVVSPAGAIGLMQLMPATARVLIQDLEKTRFKGFSGELLKAQGGFDAILKNPFINLEFGIAYLAWIRDRYRGLSPYYLVAAYNIGPARLDELLSRKNFKPVNTKRYYEAIRRLVPQMRSYHRRRTASPRAGEI